MKTVNKLYVFLTGLNGWALVYGLTGCRISSCYCQLNFRYCACLGQRALWHLGNCRVYIHSKIVWHAENTLLKNFLPLYSVLSNYFIYSRVNASYILHGGTTPVAPSKNWIKAISIHLIQKNHKKNHAYLPDSQQIFQMVTE